jgi:hypothetical protein
MFRRQPPPVARNEGGIQSVGDVDLLPVVQHLAITKMIVVEGSDEAGPVPIQLEVGFPSSARVGVSRAEIILFLF